FREPAEGGTRRRHSSFHQASNCSRDMPASAVTRAIDSPAPKRRNSVSLSMRVMVSTPNFMLAVGYALAYRGVAAAVEQASSLAFAPPPPCRASARLAIAGQA